MPKPRLQEEKIKQIITLRKAGYTLPEIQKVIGCANSTVLRYIKDVTVTGDPGRQLKYRIAHRQKYASEVAWSNASTLARTMLGDLTPRDMLIFLAGLYWGEGTKREFNVINGDPDLMKSVLRGLYLLGVDKNDIRISIRLFGTDTKKSATRYWLDRLDLPSTSVVGYEVLPKKSSSGPLKNGMCRMRVARGGQFFKQIISMVDLLSGRKRPDSSMDRALHS